MTNYNEITLSPDMVLKIINAFFIDRGTEYSQIFIDADNIEFSDFILRLRGDINISSLIETKPTNIGDQLNDLHEEGSGPDH